MKLKYYMRGLAIGIIFSVFIFTITGNTRKEKMSEDEIKQAAIALGMVEKKSNINLSVLSPTITLTPTAAPTITMPKATMTPIVTVTVAPTPTTIAPTPTTIVATPTPVAPTKATEQETIRLVITKGMYSIAVAQRAYEVGLVDDVKAFDEYLSKNGYASGIRVNTYEIKKGASYHEIAEAITKRPEN